MKNKYTYESVVALAGSLGPKFRVSRENLARPYEECEHVVAYVFTEEDAVKLAAALNAYEGLCASPRRIQENR